jgi:glucokinase
MAESDTPSKMRDIEPLEAPDISRLCEEGDQLAIEVYRRTGYIFGRGLATYAAIVNPEAIIITGGVSRAGHWLLDPTRESFESHIIRNMRGKVRIIQSDLDDAERDVLGASALAWEVPEYSLFK